MKYGKDLRMYNFARNPIFKYLPAKDRYLMAKTVPGYKFNVIGTGMIGIEHMNITYLEGRACIHGVYDPNPGSITIAQETQAQWTDKPLVIYDTLEAACNDPEVDALIIATPNYTHLDVLKIAVKSGKAIMLEKPISTTVQGAAEIVQIAESYEQLLQVGLQYRFKPIMAEAIHEALERKSLGDLKLINIVEHRIPFLDKVDQWNKFSKYSGDTLIEKCCHYFDLINLFAQSRPVSVYASGSQAVNFKEFEYDGERSDILDSAAVVITYANDIRANFHLCMFAPLFYEELILCGDEGRLRAWEQHDYIVGHPASNNVEVMRGQNHSSRRVVPGYMTWIEESGHNGATYQEHVRFVDNLEGKSTQTATAREGLWSVIVAAAAQESIKQGQVIDVNAFLQGLGVDV